jgi:hypothetical protein
VKNQIFSTVSAIALAILLTACGGQPDFQASNTSASALEASPLQMADAGATAAAPTGLSAPGAVVVAANMPQPDCAAEGCGSLRIIDGNAEAWRIDAARRATLEARL